MSSLTHILRDANLRLRFWLDSMAPPTGQPVITSPEGMAALLSELLRAGTSFRAEPLPAKGEDPDLDRELQQYRDHVARLRDLLPSIHSQLLTERAQLEAQRTRLRSAAEWARASRQTL